MLAIESRVRDWLNRRESRRRCAAQAAWSRGYIRARYGRPA